MAKPSITKVENAFQPAREVDSATRFAGRKAEVGEAYYGLVSQGAHIAFECLTGLISTTVV